VVKVIFTKGCIAAAHGRFNRIRQVAPACTPCMLHLAHPIDEVHNPNGICIGSAVFAELTIVTDRPNDRPWPRCSL